MSAPMSSINVEFKKSYQGCLFDVELEDPLQEMGLDRWHVIDVCGVE